MISLPLPPAPDLNLSPCSPFLSSVRKCARNGKTSTFGSFFASRMKEKKRRLKGKRGQGRAGRRQPGANFHSYHHLYLLRVSNGFTLRGEAPGAMVETRPTTQKWRKEEKTLHVFFRMCPRAISRRFFHSLLFFRNISTLFSRRSRFLSCAANFLGKSPPSLLPSFPFLAAGKWIS